MNTRIILIFVVTILSGCAVTDVSDDMMNNAFLDKAAIDNNVDGIWTGAIGPGLSTYIINADGNGRSCYYHRGDVIIYKQKVYEFKGSKYSMVAEDGTKTTVNIDNGYLILDGYGYKHKLSLDTKLDLANAACKEALRK